MQTATATLRLSDWDQTWAYKLYAPWDKTVSEVIMETLREIGIPLDTPFRALQRGRQLPDLETLRDAGVEEDVDIRLIPDVVAGATR
jgi:hypothetical protein